MPKLSWPRWDRLIELATGIGESHVITTDQLKNYDQRGFCVIPSAVSSEQLAMLATVCTELLAESVDDDAGGRLHNIGRGGDRRFLRLRHEDFPSLAAFVLGERIGRLAAALLGTQPFLFVEQFVVKSAETGASFAWHQDSGYVGFSHSPYLTLWIAMDNATQANGCIHVLPRSPEERTVVETHVWDEVNKERVGYSGHDPGYAVECLAGTIVAFSSTTLHRSGMNVTDQPRRAYVCQYSPVPIIDPATGNPKHFAKAFQ